MVIDRIKENLNGKKKEIKKSEMGNNSEKVEETIKSFYTNGQKNMWYYYYVSMIQLKKHIDSGEKMNCKRWNKIARENQYLSTESMRYMAGKNFDRICRDIKEIIENL